ncbi:titin [Drosophila teissieri]|uniref:titin n=1 Tax=Drosophila teissieri TaxID=7243 RepID=UPI001CBA024A|nr:titin [Drosophila teissieri]
MTNTQQSNLAEESGKLEAEEQTTLMSQAAANNNIHNSQWLVDGIANQGAESAVFCWSKAAPEVLGMAGQFPVGQGITWPSSFPMNHSNGSRNMEVCQPYYQPTHAGKFPLHLNSRINQGFPLFIWDVAFKSQKEAENQRILDEFQAFSPYEVYAPHTARFPIHQVYAPWQMNFPRLLQLPRKNSDGYFPEMSTTMTRRGQVASSPAVQAPQEFPIIKKRFVSFPNYRAMPEDGPAYPHPHPHPPTAATTTMTQPGLDKVTEIDKIDEIDGEGGGAGVHKVPPMLDNELEAEEQTAAAEAEAFAFALNLNVAREIEHQQAENLNDAFGQRRHDHKTNDDAMDGAKNKREICEQSKLEKAEDHNEPNMRDREQQSICLAREQTIDGYGQQHHHHHQNRQQQQQQQHQNQNLNRNSNHQQSGDLSDARESSPEQVDVDLGRQLTRERNPNPNPNPNPNAHRTLPNIELLKSSVRVFLAERNWDWDWDWDWELLDLLTEAIELICGHPETGNLWSEAAVGADMTVSKVSEERETETVEAYPAEQLDQPTEPADDNNNTSAIEQQPSEMKYEMKTASPALPSRSPRPESPVTRLGATSRIRNVEPTAPATHAPLLADIKRSSISRDSTSSVDVDSVLPERTRLRRQRRVRSQDSVEEKPEDVIERLNKLKARISGALSEVKGVLKQYSTESEAESAAEQTQSTPGGDQPAPVSFRFVKKVRRRSYFDEAEEEKEQAGGELVDASKEKGNREEKADSTNEQAKETKVHREQTPFARELLEDSVDREVRAVGRQPLNASQEIKTNEKDMSKEIDVSKKEETNDCQVTKELENKDEKLPKDLDNVDAKKDNLPIKLIKNVEPQEVQLGEDVLKSHAKESRDPKISVVKEEPPKINGELPKTAEPVKQPEKSKTQAKIEFLAKVQSELKSKPVKDVSPKEPATKEETIKRVSPNRDSHKEATPKESEPKETTEVNKTKDVSQSKPSETVEVSPPDESPTSPQPSKTKKKVIVKVKNPRRASIAAVEPSKIKVEPAVEQSDVLITQRRPSDSEAIVKRKKKQKLMGDTAAPCTTATTSTSPRAASSTTKDCIGNSRETAAIAEEKETATSEQLATPEVTAVPAKLPSAKSDQGTAATAAPVVVAAAATPATTATPAAQSEIDADPAIGNQAPAGDRSRRASLKLAELVGETVLVAPAATAAPQDPLPESKEPIDQEALVPATPQQVAIGADIAPQIAATLRHEESSPEQRAQSSAEATKAGEQPPPGDSLATMPELKVLAGPVQPVKIETVEQPHDGAKNQEALVKKKPTHLKKLVRKNSIDKEPEKQEKQEKQEKHDPSKLSNILRDRNKINELSSRINKLTPPKKQVKPKEETKKAPIAAEDTPKPEEPVEESTAESEVHEEVEPEPEPEVEPAPQPKKPRKIKKKVIIKRQKRRLSVGDTFFLQPEPEEPAIPEVETIERAIAYVTDDEEDTKASAEEPEPETLKELKSCLHVREYKIGDLVLYAERYRKTQVRWKRGRVLERITSISYKLEIEGKEVPAHVSYIKKYTGRKVRFGTKEYLEIDYEQVAEEERRAASYSIWNMV